MKKVKVITPETLFFILSASGILLFLFAAYMRGVGIFNWIAMENNAAWGTFDYYRHVYYAFDLDKVYEYGNSVSFPPLAYMFYHFLARITMLDMTQVADYKELLTQPYQVIVYVMYTVLGVLLLHSAISQLKINNWKKNLLTALIVCSTPMFMGALERGNMALYVVGILLLAVLWKDSDNKLLRELALILIAVAAGLKIYPAFFGILYLKEKRRKEAARLVIYGAIFFFVPFAFCGGLHGLQLFLDNILRMNGGHYTNHVQFFQGLLGFLNIFGTPAQIANYIFLFALLALALLSQNQIRTMTFLAAAMAFFPSEAYRYTLIYFLLPLIMLFRCNNERNTENYVTAAFLGLLFSIPTVFGYLTHFRLAYGAHTFTCVEAYIYAAAWLYLAAQVAIELFSLTRNLLKKRKEKHPASAPNRPASA